MNRSEYHRLWNKNNPEKVKKSKDAWREKNRDKECPNCKKFILRESPFCRSCTKIGKKLGHHSEEWNRKISEGNRGKKMSDSARKKMSDAAKKRIRTPHSEETKQKISVTKVEEKNYKWMGDAVGYGGLHMWVAKKLGKLQECTICLTTTAKRYEWANKTGRYLRDIDDWIRLCVSCHKKYDKENLIFKPSRFLKVHQRRVSTSHRF